MAEDSTKLKFRIFLGLVSLSVNSDCPVLHEEKISGNRVGFCQLDFRGSCFNRSCRWIPSGGFLMRIHLEKSTNGNQEKKGKKLWEMLKIQTEFILSFRGQNTEFSTDIKIEITETTAACPIRFGFNLKCCYFPGNICTPYIC